MNKLTTLVRTALVWEFNIWRSLVLWLLRRTPGKSEADVAYRYDRVVAPVIGLFIFASAVELVVLHVLLPWETIRLIADIVSLWGLLWMFGLLAGIKIHPHLFGPDTLRIRNGATVDLRIPWADVAQVGNQRRDYERSRAVQVDGTTVNVVVFKQTNLNVVLARPVHLQLPSLTAGRVEHDVTELRLFADEPGEFVKQWRKQRDAATANPSA